ncbi:F420-dependent methylenetetrahydromethanopterin dehydrogenase [Candidatus Bathyarchaeota archaeon]|nr:F420-dependent methylenetetrahydromethanopterin dehydrogenase [Candidatus Bathyarchaeota archaeon]
MSLPIKVCVAKIGNIGSSVLLELLLDERADREDIDVRVVSSGAKLGVAQAEDVATKLLEFKPQLILIASPNASLPGPLRLREILSKSGAPIIVVSDAPTRKVEKDLEAQGIGYIIVLADSMLGARREFLDPVEMALFNAYILKVLAITGVFNILQREIDTVIEALKKGEEPKLPRLVVDKETAVKAAGFQNPYARAKAMAAFEIARRVADLTTEGCFVIKEWERYVGIVAAAHEMILSASRLAAEARELEKAGDSVYRTPHHRDGFILEKRRLMEKPLRIGIQKV